MSDSGFNLPETDDKMITTERIDFSGNFWESTQETLRVLYSKRDPETKETLEGINDIIYRVATSVALAELKYVLSPEELVAISLEDALKAPSVQEYTAKFADAIGKQIFWANTPANINAEPEISLKVLKYWAHGRLANLIEREIWLRTEITDLNTLTREELTNHHIIEMTKLAAELQGKGCLAACGVAFVTDSLEGIQNAARMETLATKSAMGMGLNTSKLRPWNTTVSNGAAASGPDRFYEKSISKAVEAVAQGGRRGGALIELRNSDHPDILIFIDKKKLTPPPSLAAVYLDLLSKAPNVSEEEKPNLKKRILKEAEIAFGVAYAKYLEKQSYLKNTNVTVIAMPGFMEAVVKKQWYPTTFAGKPWDGFVYDPRKPTGAIDPLTKEALLEEYSVDLIKYPAALTREVTVDNGTSVRLKGHLFAPEVFDRLIEGMTDSGEPGIMFYDTCNDANANDHVYDLDTCNPCGEQLLPAGLGKDGFTYMGNCNLSSLHAAHKSFWKENGSYNFAAMMAATHLQQRFMDNVTDVSWYPMSLQNMTARMERRNGGGFAGIAEYLSKRGVGFGTEEGLRAVKDLFYCYTQASVQASKDLAIDRGVYPLFPGSQFAKLNLPVRNSCLVNNAPTGTLAQAMQTSWGVDPHNGIVFSRKSRYRYVDFVAPGFEEMMKAYGAWPLTEEGVNALKLQIRENNKSVQGLDSVPKVVQEAFPIRVELTPEMYIKHLAAIHEGAQYCKYAFNSVSNTCSIPLGFDKEQVKEATILAWRLGVKDLTFYPDGSRLSQPVEQIAKEGYAGAQDLLTILSLDPRRELKVDETEGKSYKIKVGVPEGASTLHVSLNHEKETPGKLVEIYARMGKPGAIESCLFEALGRVCSSFLQFAASFGEEERLFAESVIVKQLSDMQSGYACWHKFASDAKAVLIQSPCDGLAKAILRYRESFLFPERSGKDLTISDVVSVASKLVPLGKTRTCQSCGGTDITKIDGCWVCSCGFSKCG